MEPNAIPVTRYFRPGQFPGICFEGNDDKGTPPDPKDITFSDAQQAKLNEIVNGAVGRASKDWEKREADYKKRIEALEAASKAPAPKPEDKDPKEKTISLGDFDKAKKEWETETNSKLEAANKTIANLLGEKKKAAVVSAAAKANVVDPALFAKLVEDAIGFDEDGAVIINGEKGPRYGKNGVMTVDEYVTEFLKDKPYLVKSNTAPGGGSKQNSNPNKTGGQKTAMEKISAGMAGLRRSDDDLD